MHAALKIPEIVDAIFAQVDMNMFMRGRSDLARAARCCRQFSAPALNRLWSLLWDLHPLLKLLGAFCEEEGTCVLRGQVQATEWNRFTIYCARVRTLYYTNDQDPEGAPRIDASVFVQLAQLSRGQILFPRLRELYFVAVSLPAPELLFFQSESLLGLDFKCEGGPNIGVDYALASYLTSLPDACQLRVLTVTGKTSPRSLDSLRRFPLQKLHISKTPWDIRSTIAAVLRLDHLVDLNLDLSRANIDSMEIPSGAPHLALAALSLLGSPRSISRFLDIFPVAPNTLTNLSIRGIGVFPHHEGGIQQLIDSWSDISRACVPYAGSLRDVTFKFKTRFTLLEGGPPATSAPGMPILEPLLSCRLIDDFTMTGFPSLVFTDTDIPRLATAWPALLVLALPSAPPDAAPDAGALSALAVGCPNLVDLTISVHTRDAADQLRALSPAVHSAAHGLRHLAVNAQPMGSSPADALALFVAMFPRLKWLGSSDEAGRWKELCALFNEFRGRDMEVQ